VMFNQLARKATHCEYLNQMEANLRLALKAQAQCRATLEAPAEIKNPRPVAFVKQQNVGHNVQVNNGTAPPTVARARARENRQSTALAGARKTPRLTRSSRAVPTAAPATRRKKTV
jgi:hypothetical protein